MEINPIRSEADLIAALAEVDQYVDQEPDPDSPEGMKLEVLLTLIESYERKQYAFNPPDPIDLLNFMIDQDQVKVADLVPLIGNPNRVYEVLNGKRKLSLRMIRNLHKGLNMPLESLVKQLAS
jgi:HTH-type transcriptional regulator/antitoxin HigA